MSVPVPVPDFPDFPDFPKVNLKIVRHVHTKVAPHVDVGRVQL